MGGWRSVEFDIPGIKGRKLASWVLITAWDGMEVRLTKSLNYEQTF